MNSFAPLGRDDCFLADERRQSVLDRVRCRLDGQMTESLFTSEVLDVCDCGAKTNMK